MKLAAALHGFGTTAATIMLAAPTRADVDTDFANQLHTHGIYGPRDYDAWLAKMACNRLNDGVDGNAEESAVFLFVRSAARQHHRADMAVARRGDRRLLPRKGGGPDIGGAKEPMS